MREYKMTDTTSNWIEYEAQVKNILQADFRSAGLPYDSEIRDGLMKKYHKNGHFKVLRTYSNGLKHGISITWYPNGQMKHCGVFSHGAHIGTWQYWNEDGTLKCQIDNSTEPKMV
jgi:antitoxin component YwqK of YwqJK toxin-antitoxin module